MNNLLTFKFWFNLRPEGLTPVFQKIFIVFVVALLALTLVFAYIKSSQKKNLYSQFWRSLYYFSLTNTIIGAFLLFFNYEMVPFLSSRFWFLLWAALIIVWLFFIYKILVGIPKRKAQLEREKEFRKYIP